MISGQSWRDLRIVVVHIFLRGAMRAGSGLIGPLRLQTLKYSGSIGVRYMAFSFSKASNAQAIAEREWASDDTIMFTKFTSCIGQW